ncbi:hypothetical protein QYE76_060744 [Lolium multiflorum]|uniref:Bowman-Birk serine protease inhibitors family domain-containing protein n=1 Tax=Lolium multiflorum TaxID=4521 RepID=A0AAD8S0G1_LOLMU|nr:hypothetical protein QYE76_060744 [Lolium multiflorum]
MEMGRGRSPVPLLVIFAVLLAALPHLAESSSRHHHHHHHSHVQSRDTWHGEGDGDEEQVSPTKEAKREWPCCDNCGGCTKSIPPQCQCMDAAPGGCHPACRQCVRSALSVDPPVYQCMDRIKNFCQRRCNAVAAH